VLAADTPIRWNTNFDNGYSTAVEVGRKLDDVTGIHGLRGAIEVVYSKADVDSHAGVRAGGLGLDAVDVAVLTGDAAVSGATVGQVLANGQGSVQNTAVFANVYKDFGSIYGLRPYVGVGIGVTEAQVKFQPSAVNVIKDDAVKIAWQGKVGATYKLNNRFDVFAEGGYRASEDIDVRSNLIPAKLEIENEQFQIGIGLRMRFGH